MCVRGASRRRSRRPLAVSGPAQWRGGALLALQDQLYAIRANGFRSRLAPLLVGAGFGAVAEQRVSPEQLLPLGLTCGYRQWRSGPLLSRRVASCAAPGGFKKPVYNSSMGRRSLRRCSTRATGFLGLLASLLRRETNHVASHLYHVAGNSMYRHPRRPRRSAPTPSTSYQRPTRPPAHRSSDRRSDSATRAARLLSRLLDARSAKVLGRRDAPGSF